LERTEADLVATQAELSELTQRLADPSVYADAGLVRRLVESHNKALDRSAALATERDRLTAELATAEAAS
jgi:hypothetical protein